MPVYWLHNDVNAFPHPELAEPGGLLALGGDLSVERLILAYQHGIFPWFEEDGVFYWYAPDPRWVLFPADLKVHKSMRSVFNQNKFRYTIDTCFETVMRNCANIPRTDREGSWISEAFIAGYSALHTLGLAHSMEVWQGDELAGGLYGISFGKIFYGESMFSRVRDASKAGFITLVRALQQAGFVLVDCQQHTPHLESLGACGIARAAFMDHLTQNQFERTLKGTWHLNADLSIEILDPKG